MSSLTRSRTSRTNVSRAERCSTSELRLDVADEVVERELHVHVEHEVVGHEEREVGPAARSFEGALALVVHALDEPGQAQHVFGHALAPLAPHLRAHERLAQALRALAQLVHAFALAGQLAAQRAELPLAIGLELAHELVDLLDLVR